MRVGRRYLESCIDLLVGLANIEPLCASVYCGKSICCSKVSEGTSAMNSSARTMAGDPH